MSQLPAPRKPTLVHCPHPLIAGAGRELYYSTFLPGESIAQYIERVGIRLGRMPAILTLNGEVITRDEWALTYPKQGDLLTVRAKVEDGGGGGSDPLRTVLSIAVLIVAAEFAPALAAAWSISTAVAATIISVGGMLLIDALVPPPKPNLAAVSGKAQSVSPTYSLAGGSNQSRPYEPLPVVMGRQRVYPDLDVQAYTEFEGDDQFLYQIFNFGLSDPQLSDLLLSDFRIGNTPIGNYSGVTLQVSGFDGKITLFPGNVDSITGGALTSAGGAVQKTSSTDAVALAVEITGNLYYAGTAGVTSRSVTLKIQYRPTGTSTWQPFAYGTTTASYSNYWSAGHYVPIYDYDEDLGRVQVGQTWVQVAYGSTFEADETAGATYSTTNSYDADGNATTVTNTWRWRPYYERGSDPAPVQTYQVQTDTVTISNASTNPLRYTYKIAVPKGQYDVQVLRVTADETDAQAVSNITWSQMRTYQPDTGDYTGQLRVGLKIKASGQLSGTVDRFSALASARTWMWKGAGWTYGETSNPAWWFLLAARGKFNAAGTRLMGAGLADSRIDIDTLKDWAVFCDSKQLTFNAVFDQPQTCSDMLIAIAQCGRGAPTWASGKLGAVWDAASQPVTAVYGMANIKAGSFQVQYATEKMADEIVVNFINPDLDWQQDTVRATVPGVTSPSSPATVDLFGCTDKDMAGRAANLLAAQQRYRRKRITWDTDMEGFVNQRGDVVQLSHDMTQWGFSGRLVAGTSSQLTLDRKVTFSQTDTNYVMVRFPNGYFATVAVDASATDSDTLTLAADLPTEDDDGNTLYAPDDDPDHPPVDYLWFFAPAATPGKRVKLVGVVPQSEYYVRLTACEDPDEYYAAEDGDFTYVAPTKFDAGVPVISNFELSETLIRVGTGFAVQLTLTWNVSGRVDHFAVRSGLDGALLRDDAQPAATARRYTLTAPPAGTIVIELAAVHPLGMAGPQSSVTITHPIVGTSAPPADVPWFLIAGKTLSFGTVPDVDLAGYQVRFQRGRNYSWGDATPLHDGLLTQSPFTPEVLPGGQVTLMIKAFDTSANESLNTAAILANMGDPILANVVETIDVKAGGFVGTITGGSVDDDGDLVADELDRFWGPDDARFWGDDRALFWPTQTYADLIYECQVAVPAAYLGARLTLDAAIAGSSWKIEYRLNCPGPFWKGSDDDYFWAADDDAPFWPQPDEWRPWPGSLQYGTRSYYADQFDTDAAGIAARQAFLAALESSPTSELYDFRITIPGGAVQPVISKLALIADVPDLIERLNDVVLDAAGTRLPITLPFRVIKNVQLTLEDTGTGATNVRRLDKSVLGPLVQAFDGDTGVAATIDATVQGA